MQCTFPAKGTLCLLKPSPPQTRETTLAVRDPSGSGLASPGVPLLNLPHLPDEILVIIFEHLDVNIEWRPQRYQWGCYSDWDRLQKLPDLLPLALVCRRFQDLVEPILYRRIVIVFNSQKALPSRKRFLDAVQNRPSRCQHIQRLKLWFSKEGWSSSKSDDSIHDKEREIDDAISILRRVNANELVLRDWWQTEIDQRLCLALARLELQKLQVSTVWGQFVFYYLRQGKCSALKKLDLRCCFIGRRLPTNQLIDDAGKIPATGQRFSIRVGQLTALGAEMTAEELYTICLFIKGLKKFELIRVTDDRHCETYTQNSLQDILDLHRSTLEKITLPLYCGYYGKIPHFTMFDSLKYLRLSWDDLVRDTPFVAMKKLATSALERLTVDMDQGDLQSGPTGEFKDLEARWLTEFARCRESSSCLTHYHVVLEWNPEYIPFSITDFILDLVPETVLQRFWKKNPDNVLDGKSDGVLEEEEEEEEEEEPDIGVYYERITEQYPWPNHYLKQLKPDLAELDVMLSWTEPLLSEEQWKEKLREKLQDTLQYDEGDDSESEHSQGGSDFEEDEVEILSKLPNAPPNEGSTQRCIDRYFTLT